MPAYDPPPLFAWLIIVLLAALVALSVIEVLS